MGKSERRKGVDGEAEVRRLFMEHGADVRGYEAGGDWVAVLGGIAFHVETKRQEVARPWAWHAQAVADALPGTLPSVVFRRNRSPWLLLVELEPALVELERELLPDSAT